LVRHQAVSHHSGSDEETTTNPYSLPPITHKPGSLTYGMGSPRVVRNDTSHLNVDSTREDIVSTHSTGKVTFGRARAPAEDTQFLRDRTNEKDSRSNFFSGDFGEPIVPAPKVQTTDDKIR
jgi:hypothetical protein